MGQRAAMNAVLKEEKAAEAEARREERDARKAAEMAEARIVLEAERLTREAEKTAARIRLEERRAAFEEKRLIKEAEELAERHLRKQKECESIKARALEDLKAAIERVERAQEAATMVDNDPTYEIPDDVSVGGNSVRSSRSAKSALGLPRVPRSFKRKGRGSLPQSNSSEDEMGLNLNAALLASRSKELVNGASGPPVHSISMGGDRLASFDEDEEREDPPRHPRPPGGGRPGANHRRGGGLRAAQAGHAPGVAGVVHGRRGGSGGWVLQRQLRQLRELRVRRRRRERPEANEEDPAEAEQEEVPPRRLIRGRGARHGADGIAGRFVSRGALRAFGGTFMWTVRGVCGACDCKMMRGVCGVCDCKTERRSVRA